MYIIFLKLSLLGGIIGLDTTVVGQIMISQPLVSGAITGFLLGNLPAGILIGALLQLLWIAAIPIGSAIPPDSSLMAILATAITIMAGKVSPSSMMLAMMISIPVGLLTGKVDVIIRRINISLVHWIEGKLEKGEPQVLSRGVIIGVLLFFFKNFLLLLIFLPLGVIIQRNLLLILPEWGNRGLGISLGLVPVLGMAVILEGFVTRHRVSFFLAGGLISLLVIKGLNFPLWGWVLSLLILCGITLLPEKRISGKNTP